MGGPSFEVSCCAPLHTQAACHPCAMCWTCVLYRPAVSEALEQATGEQQQAPQDQQQPQGSLFVTPEFTFTVPPGWEEVVEQAPSTPQAAGFGATYGEVFEQQGSAACCFVLLHASSAGAPRMARVAGQGGRCKQVLQGKSAGHRWLPGSSVRICCWQDQAAVHSGCQPVARQLSHWLPGRSAARLIMGHLRQLAELAALQRCCCRACRWAAPWRPQNFSRQSQILIPRGSPDQCSGAQISRDQAHLPSGMPCKY